MSSQKMPNKLMRESARVVATELIRKPVKEAVREALHEESASVRSAGEGGETGGSSGKHGQESGQHEQGQQSSGSSQQGGGRSKLAVFGVLVAIAGVAVLARRRMSSTGGEAWSQESSPGSVARDDAEGGYVSEGEMQTAETGGEGSDTEGTGSSTSTASEQ